MKSFIFIGFLLFSQLSFSSDKCAKSFQAGQDKAQYAWGLVHYYLGKFRSQNYKRALYWLEPLAARGHSKAQYKLGFMHFFGEGVQKNEETALSWFARAKGAEQNKQRAIAYIDGWNLEYSLSEVPGWLNLETLVTDLFPDYQFEDVKYFTSEPINLESFIDYSRYIKTLKDRTQMNIIFGRHKVRKVQRKIKGKKIKFLMYEEKETDVNIATDIIMDCCFNRADNIILFSGDTDFRRTLAIAKDFFRKRVVLVIFSKNGQNNLPQELVDVVDKVIIISNRQIARNQLARPNIDN